MIVRFQHGVEDIAALNKMTSPCAFTDIDAGTCTIINRGVAHSDAALQEIATRLKELCFQIELHSGDSAEQQELLDNALVLFDEPLEFGDPLAVIEYRAPLLRLTRPPPPTSSADFPRHSEAWR